MRTRLKHIAAVRVSNVDKKTVDGEEVVKLCNYTDVYYNERITASLDFMEATATVDQRETFRLRPGDVVLTKDSETADDIGVSALVVDDISDLVCGYHLAVIRPQADIAHAPYLRWAIAGDTARDAMAVSATGVTRFGLRSEAIADLEVRLPALDEQRAIADYLDRETARLDALIAAKTSLIEDVTQRFEGLISLATDPDSDRASGPLVPLKHIAHIERGVFSHRPRNDPAFYDGDHPFIQTGDITRAAKYVTSWTQTLNDRGLSVSRQFPAGTLTMAIAANIGDVAITTFNACFPDSVVAIKSAADRLTHDYLYYALRAAKARLLELAPVNTQANLNVERIGSLKIRCPDLGTQRVVSQHLDAEGERVDRFRACQNRSIDLLRERRQALITSATTGEIEVPVAA